MNAKGGVKLVDGTHPLQLVVLDGKGSSEASLVQLRAAIDERIGFVMQGNSSAVAAALVAATDKQNARELDRRVVFLNYSADDPALTSASCSFWHFRFDAHAGMRMDALADALQKDRAVKKVYLLNQDYSFGHDVSREAQRAIREKRPDIAIAGDEFHPIGCVKDFALYIVKIRASGADAVVTGNWGNDLTLMVKAAREQGLDTKFYTFYGNGLGEQAVLGDAGVGRVIAVADWHPNAGGAASDAYYRAFRTRFPAASDDYLVLRMPLMIDMLAAAMTRAGSADPLQVAHARRHALRRRRFPSSDDDARRRSSGASAALRNGNGPGRRERRALRQRGLGLRIPDAAERARRCDRAAERLSDGAPRPLNA